MPQSHWSYPVIVLFLLALVIGMAVGWILTLRRAGLQDQCQQWIQQEASCRGGSKLQAEDFENLTFRGIEWGVEEAPKHTPTCTLSSGDVCIQLR